MDNIFKIAGGLMNRSLSLHKVSEGHSSALLLAGAVFGVFAFFLYCWAISNGTEFEDSASENLILLCLCLYGTWIPLIEFRRGHLLSPLALFFFTCLGHFGATGLMYQYVTFFVNPGNKAYILEALTFLLIFMIVFHLSYRIVVPNRFHPQSQLQSSASSWSWHSDRAIIAAAILLIVGIFARIYIIQLGVYLHQSLGTDEGARRIEFIGTLRNMEVWPNYAGLILMILTYRAQLLKLSTAYLFGAGAFVINVLNVLYWVPTGAKYQIITAVLGPFAVHYLYTKRLPSRSIMIIGISFVVALFPLSHMYRIAQAKLLEKIPVFSIESVATVVSEAFSNIGNAEQMGASTLILGRLNQIEPVAAAVRIVNDVVVPLNWGRDYLNIFTNMVPRFLWPNKPDVFYGNKFGRISGMVSPRDQYTSISVTLPAEAYLNFHIAGVFVAALISAIFSFIYLLARRLRCYDTWVLLYVVTLPTILYVGASFALYISSLLQSLALLTLMGAFIGSKKSRSSISSVGHRRQTALMKEI